MRTRRWAVVCVFVLGGCSGSSGSSNGTSGTSPTGDAGADATVGMGPDATTADGGPVGPGLPLSAPRCTASAGDATATIVCSPVPGATSYLVQRTDPLHQVAVTACGGPSSSTTCTDPPPTMVPLHTGYSYTYTVTATNGKFGSPPSPPMIVVPAPPTASAVSRTKELACTTTGASDLAGLVAELQTKYPSNASNATSTLDMRDLMNGALALLLMNQNNLGCAATNGYLAEAEQWINTVLDNQCTTEACQGDNRDGGAGDEHIGAFPESIPDGAPLTMQATQLRTKTGPNVEFDTNYTEFVSQAMPALLKLLPMDGTRMALVSAMNLLIGEPGALHMHFVQNATYQGHTYQLHGLNTYYTNPSLMNSIAQIEIVEALDAVGADTYDAGAGDGGVTALATATNDFNLVYDEIKTNGIHEFSSPTYTETDLRALTVGFGLVTDPQVHAKIAQLLDLFWSDVASGVAPTIGELAGAHSRDYQFLTGVGEIDFSLFAEGLSRLSRGATKPTLEDVAWLENLFSGQYHPGLDALRLAGPSVAYPSMMGFASKVVQENWDNSISNADRTTYVTPSFAIGTSGTNYRSPNDPENADAGESQDKVFAFQFPQGANDAGLLPPLVQVSIQPDEYGFGFMDPYGKTACSGGKPCHMQNQHVLQVQNQGAVLSVSSYVPSITSGATQLVTNIILPLAGASELVYAETPAHDAGPLTVPIPDAGADAGNIPSPCAQMNNLSIDSVVGLSYGGACFAIRVLHAESITADGGGIASIPAAIGVTSDGVGPANKAGRIAICHFAGGNESDGGSTRISATSPVRVAVYTEAIPCAIDAGAALTELVQTVKSLSVSISTSGSSWSVVVPPHNGIDRLEIDQSGDGTGSRTLGDGGVPIRTDGATPQFQVFDLGTGTNEDIWGELFN